MRVLIADAFPQRHRDELDARGHRCTFAPQLTAEELPSTIPGHDALVVRSTPVTRAALDATEELALVVRAGSGTNTIDVAAAAERGVYVCNVPGRNAIAVAELAFGLLLAIDRHIPDCVADLRAGRWNKRRYATGRGLHGRSVGVVGLGDVGLAFAERAAAFGMRVRGIAKPGRDPDAAGRIETVGIELVEDLPTLAGSCEVLSFHVPLNQDTRNLVNAELLARLPPGAIILNTSRGEIVDEEALIAAMDAKGIRAGLDVYRDEPTSGEATFDSALARHPNVYGTHHVGASTRQAQEAIADEVVAILEAFAAGEVRHCVNRDHRRMSVDEPPMSGETIGTGSPSGHGRGGPPGVSSEGG